jgi:L-lysine 2,3-aminomutase
LLKGVNDSVYTLVELSETLFAYGVIPYYLHLLDPVAGASHFEVDEASAKLLMNEVQKQLPGYLVPKLVREDPESHHKTILSL